MFLTGRLPLLLAVGAVPVVVFSVGGLDAWLVAGGWLVLCAVAMGLDVLAAASPRGLHFTRDIPARARLGEPVSARLRVRNAGARRIHGRLRDAWQPTAGAPEGRIRFDIRAGEQHVFTVPLLPRRRGELRTAFVAVRSLGPMGLAGRQRVMPAPGALRVLPPFTARRHLPSRLARLRELDGSTSVQIRGAGTEFDSLREYVRGDDVRSIDWRATARAGTTMLRTWRPERDRHIVVVIDTGRTAAARVGDGVRLDAAFEATLLLAALATRAGDHIHVILFDRLTRARVTRVDGPGLMPALVDAMAPVEPQLIDTDWDAAFAAARPLAGHPALVVLLTAQDEPEAARGFLASLPALSSAHVLVGTASDDDQGATDAGARDASTSIDDVYRAAARERSRHDADRVAAAIRRAGAESITASAEDLPPRIADRYLALKALGKL